jgi:PAS domain S-box-containing protein
MIHYHFYYEPQGDESSTQLAFSQFIETLRAQPSYSSVLIQVFSSLSDLVVLQSLLSRLHQAMPHAVMVGASSAGEIDGARLRDGGVLFSATVFEQATLRAAVSTETNSFAAGSQLATQLMQPQTRCLIAFADGITMNGEAFIRGIDDVSSGRVPIAGGMAGDGMRFERCFVIFKDQIVAEAAVAVALAGEQLSVWQHDNLSWRPIGRAMTITKSVGNLVYEIDHRPVLDIYRDYLGEEVVADLPGTAIEFPLIMSQSGVSVARSMVAAADAQGALPYAGDVPQGAQVRFGIASAQLLSTGREQHVAQLSQLSPDVIFTYSCVARYMFLGANLEAEFSALAQVAEVTGFLTYGEFFATPESRQLLNITTTTLALRESGAQRVRPVIQLPRLPASLTAQALLNLTDRIYADLAEQEDANQRLNQAIEQVLIVSRTTPTGKIVYANALFCRISGYSQAELMGQSHSIVRHPDTPTIVFEQMWKSITRGQVWQGIIKNKAKDGSAYYVKTFILPQFDHNGKIVAYLGIREEITDLIHAQDSLREQQLFTQAVMDLSDNIVLIMQNESPHSFSGRFFELFDFADMADFTQQHACICELFEAKEGFLTPSTDGKKWFEPVLLNPDAVHKVCLRDRTGKERFYQVSVRVMPFKDHYVIANFHEITDIERAKEAALMAKAQQEQFLASMSHEIRTPLNGVLGFLGLLGETTLDETQQRYLTIIKNSSQTLLSLINDILDLSKINQGAMAIAPHVIDLKHEVPLFSSLYDAASQSKSIDYRVFVDARVSDCLLVDWLRLKQIMGNLIGNAVKFTPDSGQVQLSIHLVEEDAVNQTLLISVQDTGIGIAADKQQSVFDSFAQADASTARDYGGTGLGLSISAKLAKMMDSSLRLHSELGKGSEFFLRLTVAKCDAPIDDKVQVAPVAQAVSDMAFFNVLVAEDNSTNRLLIKALLAKQGITPDFAENGLEAVAMASRTKYDLILMDIQMPELNGIQATERIRALAIQTPIVALTANAFDGERERLLSMGMNDYLSKPIDVSALTQMIRRYAEKSST